MEAADSTLIELLEQRSGSSTIVGLADGTELEVHNIAWGYDDGDVYAHVTTNVSPSSAGSVIDFFQTDTVLYVRDPSAGQQLIEADDAGEGGRRSWVAIDGRDASMCRYWLRFDVEVPAASKPGLVLLDGGSVEFRYCAGGVGVTGYDLVDGLQCVGAWLPAQVPPVSHVVRDVDVSRLGLDSRFVADPASRGVWYPGGGLNA